MFVNEVLSKPISRRILVSLSMKDLRVHMPYHFTLEFLYIDLIIL